MFGIVEVDKSLIGPRRLLGKHGRGSFGKTIVFGTFERWGKFILKLQQTAQSYLTGLYDARKVDIALIINSDGWRGYNSLVDFGYRHFHVGHLLR